MIQRVLILIFCFFSAAAFSQEALRPLHRRINTLDQEIKAKALPGNPYSAAKTESTALLQIPFLDDFHYSPITQYPDPRLWMDSSAYVNSGMPIAPPSIGVATFDGLDLHGYPYLPLSTNFDASDTADKLTSWPIDLHVVAATTQTLLPSDSIALSFYYQAKGNGETPEEADSLMLDFYKPHQKAWINVWATEGTLSDNVNDTTFKRAFVWVKDTNQLSVGDTAYLTEGFQFRFRNKATTNGDFDHWHIDYVYLDKNRSIFDTVLNDLVVEGIPTSYLKNYYAMPFRHFNQGEMATNTSVRIRSNNTGSVNMQYQNRAFTYPGHIPVGNYYDGGSYILPPYMPSGLSTYTLHSYPPIPNALFPTSLSDFTQYEIQHYVFRSQNASSDFILGNDSVSQRVDFSNYFALDDGSAEAGYYVLGQGARMGMHVQLNVPDTLYALRIYFDPVGYGYSNTDTITYRFSMNIWSAGGAGPDQVIYTDPWLRHAEYGNADFKTGMVYKLSTPISLNSGSYYIGIQQKVSTGLAIGFDVNEDHHTDFYYDSGAGWTQSGFHGSPMIRGIFGAMTPPVGIKENSASDNSFLIYPNPSSGQFVIASEHVVEKASYQLMNSLGQKLLEGAITQREQLVNTAQLNDGIYFLAIRNGNQLLRQQKIIIQH